MNPLVIFLIVFLALLFLIVIFNMKYDLLKDSSTAKRKPYSFSRVQFAWWLVIILSSFITIILFKGLIPTFNSSTLILLGISAATTATGRIIDMSDEKNTNIIRSQDEDSQNFVLDILSDGNGVNIQRFQTVLFNAVFGIWFICTVLYFLGNFPGDVSKIIPEISDNNLILLGLSSGTYAALKTGENRDKKAAG